MKFVSNRDYVYRSLFGHSIEFFKNVPVEVPKQLHSGLLAVGILPADGEVEVGKDTVVPGTKPPVLAPEDGDERADMILGVIKAMVEGNDSKNFTGGGQPNADAVSASLGWKTDVNEISKIWLAHRAGLIAKKTGNDKKD